MDKLVIQHNNIWWPKFEQYQEITSEVCPTSTTAYQLMYVYQNCPQDIASYCENKRVMIQAGGNAGFYVKKYAELFDYVYTFEPMPLLFYCLNLNVNTDNVYKFNCCLGDTNECVNMTDASETLGHGGSHVNLDDIKKIVPTIKIDNLNLPICDLIQLDLEGFELNALKGSIETIQRCKPVIVVEKFDQWAARYESSISKVDEFLKSLGYEYFDTIKSNGDCVFKYKN